MQAARDLTERGCGRVCLEAELSLIVHASDFFSFHIFSAEHAYLQKNRKKEDEGISCPMDPAADSGRRSDFWQLAWAKLPREIAQDLQALAEGHEAPAFSFQDVDYILELAQKKRAACESKQWEIELGSRRFKIRNGLSDIIDWLQKFKDVGDIALIFGPIHAAPPWAAFRFLLQAVTADRDSMETIVTVLEFVSRIILHGRVFEKVYILASENADGEQDILNGLKKTVVDLYVAVLKSLVYCCLQLSQSTGRRFLSAFLKPQEPKNVINQLKEQWKIVEDNERSLLSLHIVKTSADVLQTLRDLKYATKILVKMEENERFRIFDNISTIQVGSQHKSVHDRRTTGTGEWILDTPQFRKWETDQGQPITLLYGSPGAGKTFLISRVIDHIKKRLGGSEPNCGLAYFYCNRNDIDRRQPIPILSSLVRQLASPIGRVDEVHECIQGLDKKLRSECLRMDLQLCQDTLTELAASYQHSSIVLDALDECDEETRSELMGCLGEILSRCRNLKVFVSSRMEYDIKQYFKSQPTITIRATDNQNDIESFIREKLTSDAQWNSLDRELREDAQSILFAKSEGMFQWASLQVQELLRIKHLSNKAIMECLRTLPATLDETYGRIWEKINKQNSSDRKIGRRAIKWALSLNWDDASGWAFQEALRVDDETENLYDIEKPLPVQAIQGACYNLLVYDVDLERWKFCHLSAAEYMESAVMSELQPHRDAAIACLKYLLDISSKPEQFHRLYPTGHNFPSYASRNWHYHVKHYHDSSATKHPQLEHLIKRFLGSATQSGRAYRIWADEMTKDDLFDLQPSSSPLFGIVKFGLCRVLKDWYDHDSSIDLDVQNRNGHSLIGLAARECHFDLCQFLVAKGVNIEAGTPSPLHLLCGAGTLSFPPNRSPRLNMKQIHKTVEEIAIFLIDNGADFNTRDREGWTPLDIALDTTNKDMISTLVKHKAEIGNVTRSVINSARHADSDWIRYCLDSSTAINEHEIWSDELFMTVSNKTKPIKLLLEAGLNVNYISRNGNSLLNTAASYGKFDLVTLLIEAGANPNPKGVKKGPIYQAAASIYTGGTKCIQTLFRAGAAINPPEGVSPLVSAYESEDALHRSKLLLNLGADPNHVRHLESPLVSAARARKKTQFELFLKKGADPNSKDCFENALLLASRYTENRPRRRLLDVGADPTLTFTQGPGSALAFAAFIGNVYACSFLLDQKLGVDVNAELHGWFKNVLLAAMTPGVAGYCEHLRHRKTEIETSEIISLLLEAGANILTPMYKTLPPSLPSINFGSREFFISSARAPFGFSRHWLSAVWEIGSSPRPHLSLPMALQRYKLPSSIPSSASILIKLISISAPPYIEYAGIFIFSNTSTCFVFNKNKSKFEHFGGFQTTTRVATFEDTGKSCETVLYLTSSIKPPLNKIIGLAVFIGFVLYLMYALMRSE